MHSDAALTESRIDRFLAERLRPAVYRESRPLAVEAWTAPGEPVPFEQAAGQAFEPAGVGTRWGAPWSTTWFRLRGAVPDGWRHAGDDGDVELVVDLGFTGVDPGFQAEGMFWSTDGRVLKGLSPRNNTLRWSADGAVDVFVEAAGNPHISLLEDHFAPTPLGDPATAGDVPAYRVRRVDVALRDVPVWELVQDVTALVELMDQLPQDSTRRARVRVALDRMIDAMDPDDVSGTARDGRAVLAPVLASPAHASAHTAFAVGHAHIDSAWLWPVRETMRKCARTFSNVLALMDEDPDFVFACSSAQQYAWIKEYHPELFERIRARVAEGRFVPVGSMWVESDTNMPGGEALVRQMLEGKSFFLTELGVETRDVWLPDSFGYSGALPQIARSAGAEWFLTQKLSWNETNRMPHHTFRWEGIDGSRVFTHFPPVDSYNSELSAKDLVHAERNYAEKGVAGSSIVPFGYGDGGGGPTREMVARAGRYGSLEGVPRVRLASPYEFFEQAEAEYPAAPVWTGEMYLEFHRGTYTSQARTKRGNRRSEHLLREAELWAATAAIREGVDYPYEDLDRIWRTVLLNQFHDILPGSSIAWVYRDAERAYAQAETELEEIIAGSARVLTGDGDRKILLNAAPQARDGVAALGADGPHARSGAAVVVEREPSGAVLVTNGLVRVHVTATGQIDSLVDLSADREVVPAGTLANLLQLHRDTPRQWDAWDIDREYLRVRTDLLDADEILVEEDLERAVVRVRRTFGESSVVQELIVRRSSSAVTIVTDVDWHERQKLLKLAFPLDVHADRSAAETQFGHVFRPTHTNTSWDAARFEICAHRWVHVAEPGYGVSIANDATYGHDIVRDTAPGGGTMTTVRQSLLRAPLFPDPDADQGRHRFTTVLRPGAEIADAVADGYRTNLPPRVVQGEHGVQPIITVSDPAVVVESVKLAKDRSGDLIVRLYESLGSHARATVAAGFEARQIVPVDLLEREIADPLVVDGEGGPLQLRPFELVTLRLVRA